MPEKKCTSCLRKLPASLFHRMRLKSGAWGLQYQCKDCQRARKGSPKQLPWVTRFWRSVDRSGDCWLWMGALNSAGYGVLGKERAHRLAYLISTGVAPADQCVLHSCDQPRCVRPSHLSLGDRARNSAEMVQRGRSLKGSRQPNSRLTEAQALAILVSPLSSRELAKVFPVSARTIRKIRQGTRWAHLDAPGAARR